MINLSRETTFHATLAVSLIVSSPAQIRLTDESAE